MKLKRWGFEPHDDLLRGCYIVLALPINENLAVTDFGHSSTLQFVIIRVLYQILFVFVYCKRYGKLVAAVWVGVDVKRTTLGYLCPSVLSLIFDVELPILAESYSFQFLTHSLSICLGTPLSAWRKGSVQR